MKHIFSLSLFTIVTCLVSTQEISASSPTKLLKKVSPANLRMLAQELEAAEKTYEETRKKLCSEFLNTMPDEAPKKNFLKSGISKLIALFAAGYYVGMHHEEIENGFNEQVRPALTLSSEITFPTKEQAEAFFDETTKNLKDKIKHIALKNPDQSAETKSDEDNQNS